MKLQFSTATLMLAAAVAAITCGGVLGFKAIMHSATGANETNQFWIWYTFGVASPLWLPVAFMAFAIGRKSLTVCQVSVFAIMEAAGTGVSWLLAMIFHR